MFTLTAQELSEVKRFLDKFDPTSEDQLEQRQELGDIVHDIIVDHGVLQGSVSNRPCIFIDVDLGICEIKLVSLLVLGLSD